MLGLPKLYLNLVLSRRTLKRIFFRGGGRWWLYKTVRPCKACYMYFTLQKKSLARRKRIAQDINMSIQTLNVVKDALGSNLML